jgi:hypothetical protein
MMFCLTTGPKATESTDPGLEPPKLCAQIELSSLLDWLPQVFCYKSGKLPDTMFYRKNLELGLPQHDHKNCSLEFSKVLEQNMVPCMPAIKHLSRSPTDQPM